MRFGRLGIAALTVLLAASPVVGAGPAARLKPSAPADTVRIQVGKKAALYYRATRARPLEFKITGPTPIRVLSRLLYEGPAPAAPFAYGLVIEVDGVALRTLAEQTRVDKRATRAGGGAVGSLRRGVVQIPAGVHKVRILPADAKTAVGARLFRGDKRPKKVGWVPYAPETYEKVARLHARDSEEIYYRFSTKTPIVLTLNGPVRVRVLTRLDFGQARGYSQTYAIKTSLDGKPWQSFSFKVRASHTSTYPELREITPGAPQNTILEVPHGRHTISIALDCTTAGSASMRILIPKKAVKNGA